MSEGKMLRERFVSAFDLSEQYQFHSDGVAYTPLEKLRAADVLLSLVVAALPEVSDIIYADTYVTPFSVYCKQGAAAALAKVKAILEAKS